MFACNENYYQVEEGSMEEFLQVIKQQREKSSQYEKSKINHLERKFIEFYKNAKQQS